MSASASSSFITDSPRTHISNWDAIGLHGNGQATGGKRAATIEASIPISGLRSGKQLKLIVPPAPTPDDTRRDPALTKLVVQALSLRNRLAEHQAVTLEELARLGYGREHAADLLRVSYLAPDILTAIVDGRQPAGLSRTRLIKTPRMPLSWQDQRRLLGFA